MCDIPARIECGIARPHNVRYVVAMTANSFARPFFEFISSHDLSLYKVAKTAEISEGTLRAFRDIEGRQLNFQTRNAVIRALSRLTNESINIAYLFGTPEQHAEQRDYYFQRPIANTKFADILWKNGFNERNFVDMTGIDESAVIALLNNEQIDIVGAKQIADVLSASLEDIGYSPLKEERHTASEVNTSDMPRNLAIREINKREDGELYITGRIIGYTVRPPSLMGNSDAYALYVYDNDMSPRLKKGELIYVDPHWPANPICDVVIHIRSGENAGNIIIAAFTMRSGDNCTFTHYKSSEVHVFDEKDIDVHKILFGQELIIR